MKHGLKKKYAGANKDEQIAKNDESSGTTTFSSNSSGVIFRHAHHCALLQQYLMSFFNISYKKLKFTKRLKKGIRR
jgi:hypothetical protein